MEYMTSTPPAVWSLSSAVASPVSPPPTICCAPRERRTVPLRVQVIERDRRLGGKIRTDTFGTPGRAAAVYSRRGTGRVSGAETLGGETSRAIWGWLTSSFRSALLQPATSVLVHGRPVPLPEGLRLITPTKLLPFLYLAGHLSVGEGSNASRSDTARPSHPGR